MNTRYDRTTDSLYIELRPLPAKRSVEIEEDVVLDVGRTDNRSATISSSLGETRADRKAGSGGGGAGGGVRSAARAVLSGSPWLMGLADRHSRRKSLISLPTRISVVSPASADQWDRRPAVAHSFSLAQLQEVVSCCWRPESRRPVKVRAGSSGTSSAIPPGSSPRADDCFCFETLDSPGTFVPPHIHPCQGELIYVLEGSLDLRLGDDRLGAEDKSPLVAALRRGLGGRRRIKPPPASLDDRFPRDRIDAVRSMASEPMSASVH